MRAELGSSRRHWSDFGMTLDRYEFFQHAFFVGPGDRGLHGDPRFAAAHSRRVRHLASGARPATARGSTDHGLYALTPGLFWVRRLS